LIELERLGLFIGETIIRTSQDCVDDGPIWSESILEGECARDMHSRAYVTSGETKDSQVPRLAGGSKSMVERAERCAQMAGTLARQTGCHQAFGGKVSRRIRTAVRSPMRPRVSHRTALLYYCMHKAFALHLGTFRSPRLTSFLPRDIARCPCD
jgi:hypothetical protein